MSELEGLAGAVNAALQQLLGDEQGRFSPVQIVVRNRLLTGWKEAREAILPHWNGTGWVCLPDRVCFLPEKKQDGIVLAAEVCTGERASLQLVPDGAGCWQLVEIEETNEGEEVLADTVVLLNRRAPNGRIAYRRYWRKEKDGFLPFAARLIGFGEE